MARRKGELSTIGMDWDYPHQVVILGTRLRGSGGVIIDRFSRGLSVCPRHHRYLDNSEEYYVYCFKDAKDAQYFAHHLGGEIITIEERKKRQKASHPKPIRTKWT